MLISESTLQSQHCYKSSYCHTQTHKHKKKETHRNGVYSHTGTSEEEEEEEEQGDVDEVRTKTHKTWLFKDQSCQVEIREIWDCTWR